MVNKLIIRNPGGIEQLPNNLTELLQSLCVKHGFTVSNDNVQFALRNRADDAETLLDASICDDEEENLVYENYRERIIESGKAFNFFCEASKDMQEGIDVENYLAAQRYAKKIEKKYLTQLDALIFHYQSDNKKTAKTIHDQDLTDLKTLLSHCLHEYCVLIAKITKKSHDEAQLIIEKADQYQLLRRPRPAFATILAMNAIITDSDEYFVMLDVPQTSFSREIAEEVYAAKAGNPPKWYQLFTDYERLLFNYSLKDINNVEDLLQGGFYLPSRLRTLLGLPNIWNPERLLINAQGEILHKFKQSPRSSIPASRNIDPKEVGLRDHFTELNMRHLLRNWIEKTFPDSSVREKINFAQIPMVWQTLISPISMTEYINKPDKRVHDDKLRAIQKINAEGLTLSDNTKVSLDICDSNNPVNLLAKFCQTNGPLETGNTTQTINKIINWGQDYLCQHYSNFADDKNIKSKLSFNDLLIYLAINDMRELLHMTSFFQSDKDARELMFAALQDICINALGGCIVSQCMSGKDRAAVKAMARDAMEICAWYFSDFPKYLQPEKNTFYYQMFSLLHMSEHHQTLANCNAPGAGGVKFFKIYAPSAVSEFLDETSGTDINIPAKETKITDNIAGNNEFNAVLAKTKFNHTNQNRIRQAFKLFKSLQKPKDQTQHENIKQELLNIILQVLQVLPGNWSMQIPCGIQKMRDLAALTANLQFDTCIGKFYDIVIERADKSQLTRSSKTQKFYDSIIKVYLYRDSDFLEQQLEKIKSTFFYELEQFKQNNLDADIQEDEGFVLIKNESKQG